MCCTCCSVLRCFAVRCRVSFSRGDRAQRQCVAVCCSVVQCAAVCCSVLQRVVACCSVVQYVAVSCSVLQCVAVCCSVLQCVAAYLSSEETELKDSMLQYVAVCCSRRVSFSRGDSAQRLKSLSWLQCGAVCCSVLQYVAVCFIVSQSTQEPLVAAVCCSVLQRVGVCCSVFQCVAEYSRASRGR